jgi:hypothetical protein
MAECSIFVRVEWPSATNIGMTSREPNFFDVLFALIV